MMIKKFLEWSGVIIAIIYSLLTLTCATFYKLFGMSYFDSLTHSMTTIATGGFSNYNDSIGHFNSALIEINAIIFIILNFFIFLLLRSLVSFELIA